MEAASSSEGEVVKWRKLLRTIWEHTLKEGPGKSHFLKVGKQAHKVKDAGIQEEKREWRVRHRL